MENAINEALVQFLKGIQNKCIDRNVHRIEIRKDDNGEYYVTLNFNGKKATRKYENDLMSFLLVDHVVFKYHLPGSELNEDFYETVSDGDGLGGTWTIDYQVHT